MQKRYYGTTVDQTIKRIRAFHATGLRSLDEFPDGFSGGQGKQAAQRLEVTLEELEKARAFAKQYPKKRDLDRLCREIETSDFPIGVQHLVRIQRLAKNSRAKFLRMAIENRWGCRQLAAAIQQRTGRRHAGRTPLLRDPDEALRKLLEHCGQWQRLYRVIQQGNRGDEGAIGVKLPGELQNVLRRYDRASEELGQLLRRSRIDD